MLTKQVAGILTRAQGSGDEGEVTITTAARDLMGDTIDPAGMETSVYLAGPAAVNFAHDHGRLPVAKTLALHKSAAGIRARFRWRMDPDSQAVRAAFDDGVLGASVEFIVPEGGAVQNGLGGYHFPKTILTGWALTGNPANPGCVKLLKSLRLERGPELAITLADGGDEVVLELEETLEVEEYELVAGVRREVKQQLASVVHPAVAAAVREMVMSLTGRVD